MYHTRNYVVGFSTTAAQPYRNILFTLMPWE